MDSTDQNTELQPTDSTSSVGPGESKDIQTEARAHTDDPQHKQPDNSPISSIEPEPNFNLKDVAVFVMAALFFGGAMKLTSMYSWLIVPSISVASTVIATQFATTAMRHSLRNLAERRHPLDRKQPSVIPETIRKQIDQAVIDRAGQIDNPIGYTVEAYLSQVVANWAFVVLTIGNLIALQRRAHEVRSYDLLLVSSLVGDCVMLSLLTIGATILFGKFPLEEYYNPYGGKRKYPWREFIPPRNKVTYFRICFFLLYVVTTVAVAIPIDLLHNLIKRIIQFLSFL